ncbi:hypothetical protein TI10_08325 [Photorhabdus luminescens subsp. luminescens]|nr:hypothetical protein TI10_08325 [Photorhabdus luminescens subsp. luminescens]
MPHHRWPEYPRQHQTAKAVKVATASAITKLRWKQDKLSPSTLAEMPHSKTLRSVTNRHSSDLAEIVGTISRSHNVMPVSFFLNLPQRTVAGRLSFIYFMERISS